MTRGQQKHAYDPPVRTRHSPVHSCRTVRILLSNRPSVNGITLFTGVYLGDEACLQQTANPCTVHQLNPALGAPFGLPNDAGKGGSEAPGGKKRHSTRHRLSTGYPWKLARTAHCVGANVASARSSVARLVRAYCKKESELRSAGHVRTFAPYVARGATEAYFGYQSSNRTSMPVPSNPF
jgi:hypothetical protein